MVVKSGRILIISIIFKLIKKSEEIYDIIEGDYTNIEKFSYSVFLNVMVEEDGMEYGSRCGASVLNQRMMLTAAHCLDESHILMLETVTGSTNHNHGLVRRVHAYTKHIHYQREPVQNDIGVFRLFKNLELGPQVSRVVLVRDPPLGAAEVAGWGVVTEQGHTDPRLKFARQKILPLDKCEDMIDSIPEGMFCAMHPHGYTGRGDSGSAIVLRRHIQIGIVSFSRIAGKKITVYTNTSHYLRWIHRATKRLGCGKRSRTKSKGELDNSDEVVYLSNGGKYRRNTSDD